VPHALEESCDVLGLSKVFEDVRGEHAVEVSPRKIDGEDVTDHHLYTGIGGSLGVVDDVDEPALIRGYGVDEFTEATCGVEHAARPAHALPHEAADFLPHLLSRPMVNALESILVDARIVQLVVGCCWLVG